MATKDENTPINLRQPKPIGGIKTGVIPASTLNAETPKPIDLPAPPIPDDTSGVAAGALAGAKAEPKDTATSKLENLLAEEEAPESQTEAFISATTTPEILEKEKRTKASRGRLLALQAEQQALANIQADIPEQVEGEFRGRASVRQQAGISGGRTREVRRQQLDITNRILAESAIFSAESGDLNDAITKIDKIFSLKQKDAEAQADFKDKQIDRAMDFASAEQKDRLAKMKAENDKVTEKAKNENETRKTFSDAYLDAGDAKTAAAIASATTQEQVDRIIDKTPLPISKKDTLANRLTEIKILNMKDEIRSRQDADKIKALEAKTGSTLPDSLLSGMEEGDLKDNLIDNITSVKLTETQGKAVAFALRMINSNRKLNQQIGYGRQTKGEHDPTTLGASIGRLFGTTGANTMDANMLDFVGAALRFESGAAIPPSEIESGNKIYSPAKLRITDEEIINFTTRRNDAILAMISATGEAGKFIKQYYDTIGDGLTLSDEEFDEVDALLDQAGVGQGTDAGSYY